MTGIRQRLVSLSLLLGLSLTGLLSGCGSVMSSAGAVRPQADAEQLPLVEDGLGSLLHSGSGSLSEAVHGQTGLLKVSLKEVRDERVEIHDAVTATGFGLVKGSANPHELPVTIGRIISDPIKAARVV